jgi:Protein of unknown function (DUF4238)
MPNAVNAAEPKGHHYVPAMYLRGFAGAKGQLFAINRAEDKWFRTSPDNVAKKKTRQMLVAADDTGGFVTTDDPVCLRWSDGQPHGGMSPGFALAGTEVIFPLSTNIALRGTFEGEENVVKSDMATVAQLNSLIISNAENKVYAHDHAFKFKRWMPDELGSGATLLQDKDFIAAGERR